MARENRTSPALLGFLTWGTLSGYDLRGLIELSISNFWQESFGRIYPTLRKLAQAGLAEVAEEVSPGGRRRKAYTITPAGRKHLVDWLEQPYERPTQRNELLLKLFFGSQVPTEVSVGHVERFQAGLLRTRTRYAQIRKRLESGAPRGHDRAFWLMTLSYGEREVDAHLAWCEEALAELARMAEAPGPSRDGEA